MKRNGFLLRSRSLSIQENIALRLVSIGLLALVSLCLPGCERKLTVQERDKTLFLRAQDLVKYGYGFEGIEKYESFSKTKGINGSYDIEYEFKTPEGERNHPLFLYVLVTVDTKESDAIISEGATKIALLARLNTKGISEQKITDFYRRGDSSAFYVLKKGEKPIGNYFTMREGRKVYAMILTGMYFDDAEVWKELIDTKVAQLSAYSPV